MEESTVAHPPFVRSEVLPEYRMIEVPDQVILDSLAHMPPYESVARAMREVLCLRQQLREIAQEQVRSAWPKRRG